jgi:phosphoribosylformylglycinamidine synthase
VVLLGEPPAGLGASEYLPLAHEFPRFDLDSERRLGQLLRVLAARGLLRSAQDVADGGLGVALAECAFLGDCGCKLHLDEPSPADITLFSEDQGRAVVTCSFSDVDAVLTAAAEYAVVASVVGETGGDRLTIADTVDVSIARLRESWEPTT